MSPSPVSERCGVQFLEGPRWDVASPCGLPIGHVGPHVECEATVKDFLTVPGEEFVARASAEAEQVLLRAEIEQLRHSGDLWMIGESREKARADAAEAEVMDEFVRGASWAYGELTGAVIVPASFEEQARKALEVSK